MSLIDYLRALQSTTAARPGNMSQTITPIGDGQNQMFVMPADGWVSLGGWQTNNEYGAAYIWGASGKERPTASTSSTNSFGYTAQALGFFKKGEQVNYNLHGFTNYYARIFPVIGGGLNSIIQSGGELCLRLKTIFNRCSSYPAGKRTQTESRFKSTGHLVVTQLRVMALSYSALHQSKDEAHLSMHGGRFPSQATARQSALPVLQSRALKVNVSNGHTAERLTFTHLHHPRAHLSFCEGGAL